MKLIYPKKICAASDREDYEDVRVLLEQLKDVIYAEMRDMKQN